VAREEIYGRSRAIVNLICEQMIELFVAQKRDKAIVLSQRVHSRIERR